MEYIYRTRSDVIFDEDGKKHIVYGIEAMTHQNIVITSVSDIFFNERDAQAFVELCNNKKLSLIHLPDVIEDILT